MRIIKLLSAALLLAAFLSADSSAFQKIQKISGDNQSGIAGYPLTDDYIVLVTSPDGSPLAGVPVIFNIIYQPSQPAGVVAAESVLIGGLTLSDQNGYARARLNSGYPEAGDIIVTAATKESVGMPAVFKTSTRNRGWIVTLFLGIIGGLGLFLFGMFYLNDALQKIAGAKLRDILMKLTRSPLKGMGAGLFVTLLNQSSSATTVLEVSLVSAGLITFYQTLAITMGAEIGSTVTSQLLAFRLADYSVLIAGAGFFMTALSHSRKWKNTGEALLGFGILFLGMKIMADMLAPLRGYAPFLSMMTGMEEPLLGILAGFGFTAIIQSSGATAGIVIALALAGAINLKQAVLINLGAQVGTCITALIASIGRGREGRRVALWHLFHQTAGVAVVYPLLTVFKINGESAWLYIAEWVTRHVFFANDLARQIAMAHTLAAVLNAAVFFMLLPVVYKLMLLIMPVKEQDKPFGPQFIDDNLLPTPALALEQARREVSREGEIVSDMLKASLNLFRCQDLRMCDTVSLKDIRADILRNAIVAYLSKLAQGALTEDQSQQQSKLLLIASDLEEIGDIVDKNIVPLARKKIGFNMNFSEDGWKDIVELHAKVSANLELAVAALKDDNMRLAQAVAGTKVEINEFESEMRKRHVGRLNAGLKETLETSSVHLDLIDHFKRINSHTATIGMTITGQS